MATSAGEIEVTLTLKKGDFDRMLGDTKAQLQSFGDDAAGGMAAVGAAVAAALVALAVGLKKSIDAYAGYETSVTHLTSALHAQGIATDDTTKHLTAMAHQLQELTGVSDDEIIAAQSLLVTHGLQGQALDKATKAALDLSVAMGIDLNTAAQLLGKAFEGNTSTLSRYGIKISEHTDTSRKFAAVMQQMQERFGGAAQAQANTYTGKMNIMKAAFEDLEKTVGALLVGPVGEFLVKLTSMIAKFTDWVSILANVHKAFGDFGSMLSSFMTSIFSPFINSVYDFELKLVQIIDKIPGLHSAAATLNLDITDARNNVDQQTAAWKKNMDAAAKALQTTKQGEKDALVSVNDMTKGVFDASESQTRIVHDQMIEELKLRSEAQAQAKAAHLDFMKVFITTEASMWNFATQMTDAFFQGVGDSFAAMIVDGKSFADSMKAIFHDMAKQLISYIIQIIIKMMALLTLESIVTFGGTGAAEASTGLDNAELLSGLAADGGMINEPSIITGLRSGRRILAGEAGPEAIVPMGGTNQVASEMGGTPSGGGGGSITINISGQFIDGDSNSWQRLMREKIIPQIRRFTMSSPTGPFNRTRGVV